MSGLGLTRSPDGSALWRGQAMPVGPWHVEPDHLEFRAEGLACIIHRNELGAWCGYVGVPPGHPWHGLDYSNNALIGIEVHGGLTYSERCQGPICHVPQPGESDDVWWLGFDCNHLGDASLFDIADPHGMAYAATGGTYRTAAYVRAEVESLAAQAGKAGRP